MTNKESWVAVAIVLRPHALGGALVLKPLTRTPDEFLDAPIDKLHVRLRGQIVSTLTIEEVAIHKSLPLVHFHEVHDRTAAEALIGAELVIPESERWDLGDGQFYYDQLEGLTVVEEGDGRSLGAILRVFDGAVHDFLVVAHPEKKGKEVMIPFVRPDIVRKVDLAERVVTVRLPEGLLDL